MATIDIKGTSGGGGGSGTVTSVAVSSTTLTVTGSPITTSGTIVANIPDGYLKVGTGVTGSLQNVVDTNGTATTLFLSSTAAQFTSPLRITTSDASGFYLDAEDSATNNRFSIKRDPSSQEVTLDFASNPAGSTTLVGAIRTYGDGVNLSNAMSFREDGNVGIGTDSPGSKLDVHSTGATVAQFNKTVSGNSYIQQLTAGAGKWKHGFTSATGAFDIIDDVNSLTRLSLLNTGQLKLNAYTSTSAFTGTTAGFLAFDASGNILSVTSPATSPSGVSGSVQFTDGTNFASDGANFFWDDTNNRLGIGTNAPSALLNVKGASGIVIDHTGDTSLAFAQNGTTKIFMGWDSANNGMYWFTSSSIMNLSNSGNLGLGGVAIPTARLQVKGSGSTSATTGLLVQNSAGTQMIKVSDDGQLNLRSSLVFDINTAIIDGGSWYQTVNNQTVNMYGDGGASSGVRVTGSTYSSGASQIQIKGSTSISSGFNQPDASAQLDVSSTTKGFLPPRMTTAEKNAIATPAAGLVVYDTTLNKLCVRTAAAWETITSI